MSVRYDRSMRARQPVGRPPFHPRQLFTVADIGFVQDPRVASALFEESTGITPAVSGRPNGLLLDSRFNLLLGPNLVTNGGFDSSLTGWTSVGGVANSWQAGTAVIAYSFANGGLFQDVPFMGRSAVITVRAKVNAGSGASVWCVPRTGNFNTPNTVRSINGGTYQDYVFTVEKELAATGVRVYASVGPGAVLQVDNISVQERFGNHASQASPPSRPIFQPGPSRVVFDGVDDSHITTFTASLGSACTVARAIPGTGAQILTGQTIGTSFSNTVTHAGMVVINRALTGSETANLTSWLNRAAGL